MRTASQIESNISNIENAVKTINEQISLLEKEYQANALENIGMRCDSFDALASQLRKAAEAMNEMFHLEIDSIYTLNSAEEE